MAIDHIHPSHEEIHKRLVNWARWVRPNHRKGQVQPMFRGALTSRQWDIDPQIRTVCDTLDAMRLEKVIVRLPRPNMLVLKWWYVFPVDARRMCRTLATNMDGLCLLLQDARSMAANTTRSELIECA